MSDRARVAIGGVIVVVLLWVLTQGVTLIAFWAFTH